MADLTLLNDATSPFGRKILIAALERSIPMSEEFVDLTGDNRLACFNPLRQIPVLLVDGRQPLYDSDTILLYLDTAHNGAPLFPEAERWAVQTDISLANGLMEATLLRIMEIRRPAGEQSPAFINRMEARIARALGAVDSLAPRLSRTKFIGREVALAAALGYVDFRYKTDWRADFPAAAAWAEAIHARPSLMATRPERTGPIG
jgi:glutathione S-transferase